ncbi:MAG TPA: Fe-S cluster assembly protein SufD [Pirellulales bacterium]|jgi:Fe-S cluster assembly protein SufD|nr:Fe-S cluster assembly protein SufD [Pirellulales bacterium]
MPATAAISGFSSAAFEAFLQSRGEPEWLVDMRRAAWKEFESLPTPSRGDEEWMRTELRMFHLDRFQIPMAIRGDESAAVPAAVPDALLTHGVEPAGATVVRDGRPIAASLDPQLAKRGVLFGSLDALVAEHGDLIRRHLFRAMNPSYDKFAALHAACWTGGTLLYVPRGVVVDRPFHTLSGLSARGVDLGHILVILEPGAEATLLSETAGGSNTEAAMHCGGIELLVGENATLRYVNLQNWGHGVWHFAHQKGLVNRDGRLQWTIGALGSRLAKVNQHVALVGPGAQTQVNGVMFTEGKQHLTYNTLQHHAAPHCKSDLLYKGGLQDQSRLVWRGMIKVDPIAQQTDGYQRNDNLMLSEESRADSIPGLEIQADDVRCTHGSTTGRVDDEQIFYCQARGLTRKEAIRTVVAGFFQQVFDRITIESVREALGQAIDRRVREYE